MTIQTLAPGERDLFKIVAMLRELAQGRSNASGSLNLTANAGSTTVAVPTCATGASVHLTPGSANASAEWKNGTIYASTVSNGSFVITHANNAQTDRLVYWSAYG